MSAPRNAASGPDRAGDGPHRFLPLRHLSLRHGARRLRAAGHAPEARPSLQRSPGADRRRGAPAAPSERNGARARHPYGKGRAYYLGAVLDQTGYNGFYQTLQKALRLEPPLSLPEGLYATVRCGKGRDILFINNPAVTARAFTLESPCTDLLSGARVEGTVTLPPFGVLVCSPVATPRRRRPAVSRRARSAGGRQGKRV